MPAARTPHTLPRRRFRHAGGQPDHHRQSGRRAVHRGRQSHHLVLEGDPSFFDADRAAVRRAEDRRSRRQGDGGRFDYPHYYLLNMVTEAGGGLEHKNSFLGMTSRFTTRTHARSTFGWLGLVAHEYFHNWNIKRLRPIELGPFDYENEVLHQGAVDRRGLYRLLRRLLVRRAGALDARRVSRRAVGSDRSGADHARASGDAGGHGVVRHLDQAVPARTRTRRTRPSTTTRKAR